MGKLLSFYSYSNRKIINPCYTHKSCPVDSFVFPELDKLRTDDSLEARFNAFKIPESNFLVFEATVRSCREGCQPVSLVYLVRIVHVLY